MNCDSGKLVENGDERTFVPTVSGNYSVIVAKNECVVESDCLPFTVVGIESVLSVNVYPNPAFRFLYVDTPDNQRTFSFQIVNVNRQVVREYKNLSKGFIDIGDLSAGVYFIRTNRYPTFRLVKK